MLECAESHFWKDTQAKYFVRKVRNIVSVCFLIFIHLFGYGRS